MKKSLILMLPMLLCVTIVGCSMNESDDAAARLRKPDASVHHIDAPAPSADAASGGGGTAGSVTCYLSAAPNNTCALSTSHCCFSEYDASHNGQCEPLSTTCGVGQIDCDGPEDCSGGQSCFAHHWYDVGDMPHWLLACAATATDPTQDRILCHPNANTCPAGKTCVQAAVGGIYDLPKTIYLCN